MPKVQSDIGAVATAWSKTVDFIKKLVETTEIRNLKAAARSMQRYIKRVEKISPEVKKDKQLRKYKREFERKIV
jgi:hypothetical protein